MVLHALIPAREAIQLVKRGALWQAGGRRVYWIYPGLRGCSKISLSGMVECGCGFVFWDQFVYWGGYSWLRVVASGLVGLSVMRLRS